MKQFNIDESNLPSDFSWLEMEDGIWGKVDRRKRKRRILLFFLFIIVGSSIAWSIWSMLDNPIDNEAVIASQIRDFSIDESCLKMEKKAVVTEEFQVQAAASITIQNTDNQSFKNELVTPLISKTIPQFPTVAKIKVTNSVSNLESDSKLLVASAYPISAPKIISIAAKQWKRIAIYSGINSFERNTKNQSSSEINHSDLETSQVGMQVDFRYEWSNRKEAQYWGIGMNYTRLHSRFEYFSEREITVTRDLYLSPWELLLPREYLEQIYRQVQIKAIEKRRIVHHNSQNLLDFSLYKGVQKQWKTIDLYANLGGRLNVVHWANGKTADTSGEVILLEDMEYYKWNLGANFFMETGLRYPISDRLHFSGNLGLQQSLNNWIREAQLVQQKPRVYWLNFGLSYGFE